MKLFTSSTSPFARIVRIVLREKAITYEEVMVDPWSSPESLFNVNPALTVPVLEVNGLPICNSLFIIRYLERAYPDAAPAQQAPEATALTALAFAMVEAFASIIIGRRSIVEFDSSGVGLRRRNAIAEGVKRLEAKVPAYTEGDIPDLLHILLVVLIDALHFRFGCPDWLPDAPQLTQLSCQLNERPAFYQTKPVLN